MPEALTITILTGAITLSIIIFIAAIVHIDGQRVDEKLRRTYEVNKKKEVLQANNTSTGVSETRALFSSLTPQEIEVIKMIATGGTDKVIADTLRISHSTVKNHIRSLRHKLNAKTRSEAVARFQALQNPMQTKQ